MSEPVISAKVIPHDDAQLTYGSGPLWHPERNQLFWFDILKMRLLTRNSKGRHVMQFDEQISAAGWVDRRTLLVASEHSLSTVHVETGAVDFVQELDEENPATRSGDGRADAWGGFWVTTMGKAQEAGLGAVHRYYKGELRRLFGPYDAPGSIAFSADRGHAVFGCAAQKKLWRVALDEATGWPTGEPEVFIDLKDRVPAGAVFDAHGTLWCAQWGANRVASHDATGKLQGHVEMTARNPSGLCFGGEGMLTLFVTTAREGIARETNAVEPQNGQTFAATLDMAGQAEHRVAL